MPVLKKTILVYLLIVITSNGSMNCLGEIKKYLSDSETSPETITSTEFGSVPKESSISVGASQTQAFAKNVNGKMATGIGTNIFPMPPVEINFAASRTTGVAPLGVFFTAGFSSSTSSASPFHDLEYSWDFGDTNSANKYWAIEADSTSNWSKNTDKGPVAAHVFEEAKEYTVTLTIRDVTGVVDTKTIKIDVTDPAVVYGEANTYCYSDSTNNNFAGCPTTIPGQRIVTDNITDIASVIATGKQVLLHRGSDWVVSDRIGSFSNVYGPVTIGAYGICDTPDARGICNNAPLIIFNKQGDRDSAFHLNYTSDWRIMDINFIGQDADDREDYSIINANTDLSSLLYFRTKVSNLQTAIRISRYKTAGHQQVMIVDNDISDTYMQSIYMGSEHLVIMGNYLRDSETYHMIRIWHSYLGVISHNNVSGASWAKGGKHALKLHGPKVEIIGCVTCLDNPTRFTLVSDNIFGSSCREPVAIGPQNATKEEHLADILVEKNRFLTGYGRQSIEVPTTSLSIWANDVTVRNNIIDGEGSSIYYSAIMVGQRGVGPKPKRVNVYNNTIYKNDPAPAVSNNSNFIGINIKKNVSQSEVKNNLITFPAWAGTITDISVKSGADVAINNNLVLTDPKLVDPDNTDFLLKNYNLSGTSEAIDKGTSVPVYDDFSGLSRLNDKTYDLGAFEYVP